MGATDIPANSCPSRADPSDAQFNDSVASNPAALMAAISFSEETRLGLKTTVAVLPSWHACASDTPRTFVST